MSKETGAQVFNAKKAPFIGLHPGRFAGKVCFITGATSGLGEHAAYHLAQEGCAVAVTGRRKEEGAAVVAHINSLAGISTLDPPAMFIQVDVTKEDSVNAAVAEIEKTWGRLDSVFANAGVSAVTMAQGDPDSSKNFQWLMDVNVVGVWKTVLASVPLMKQNGGGQIVLTSSVAGLGASPLLSGYIASKHALEGMKKALAAELIEDNIRVNNLNPSFTPTELTAGYVSMPAFHTGAILEMQADSKLSKMGQTSSATAYLLSSDSQYVSGLSLPVSLGAENNMIKPSQFKSSFFTAVAQAQAQEPKAAAKKEEL